MDRINIAKKRLVHPERLDLNTLMKTMSPVGSWCETSSASASISDIISLSTPHPGLKGYSIKAGDSRVLSLESLSDDDYFVSNKKTSHISSSSLNTWDQRSFGHRSPISTIYHPTYDDNNALPFYHEDSESIIHKRIRQLIQLFRERAQLFRRRLELPPTPSTIRSEKGGGELSPPPLSQKIHPKDPDVPDVPSRWTRLKNWRPPPLKIDPQGYVYVTWLSLVTSCFLYNACVIPLRSAFPYQTPTNTFAWFVIDYTADAIYLIDLILVKPRLKFLDQGFWNDEAKLMRNNYFNKLQFKLDVLALLPLDLFYFMYGSNHIWLRLPRFLKFQSFGELYGRLDSMLPSPYIVRVARTILYMLYMIHCNACSFYAFSAWEGIASNAWVFNGIGNAYIRCFFFATKTATGIGKNPKPENNKELVFMTWNWLQGVFVFALLISQMRDIVASATGVQNEYRQLVDVTLEYMRRMNLPLDLQERVKLWFTFTWAQQRTLDERRITNHLPHKLKTDVALSVHIQTLNKVQLFKDCDETLLRELVHKLKPVIFLPGDLVIKKGEIGKEMYIVKTGQVQVMGGVDSTQVLATLSEGSVFGEIALLSLAEGNRRTATVRSRGYSNIFVLNKTDLNEAIEHYPAAQKVLKDKAESLMRENSARQKEKEVEEFEEKLIIGNKVTPPDTPKLLHTVLQVVSADSGTARLLKYGTRPSSFRRRPVEPKRPGGFPRADLKDKGTPRLHITDHDSSTSSSDQRPSSKSCADFSALSSEENIYECRVQIHREMSQ